MTNLNGAAVAKPGMKFSRIEWTPEQRAVLDARLALEARFPVAFAQWNATMECDDYSVAADDALEAVLDAIATGVDAQIWPDMGICSGEPVSWSEFNKAAKVTAWERKQAREALVRACSVLVTRHAHTPTESPWGPEDR